MATLIKERRIGTSNWQLLDVEDGRLPELPAGDLIVPLVIWRQQRDHLIARAGGLGVRLEPADDPASIAHDLDRFAVVAVNFPKAGDGRGYSIARLLRERYCYRGELRAVGEVLRDHLQLMARCGFDAFALRDDQDPQEAIAAFDDFSEAYQGTVERPLPLFRRRFPAAA